MTVANGVMPSTGPDDRSGMAGEWVSRGGRAAMVVATLLMVWRGQAVVGWLQSGLFTAVAFWFALRAAAVRSRRLAHLHDGVLAAAMVWMVVTPHHHGHAAGHVAAAMAGYCAVAAVVWLAVAAWRRQWAASGHAAMSIVMGVMASGF